MNYVLKSILDMDKKAREQKEDAELYRKGVFNSVESEKDKLIKAELETARKKVELIGEGFKKGADKKIQVVSQKNDAIITELFKKQADNEKRWIDELYERVLRKNP